MGTASLPFRSLATRSSGKGGRIPFRRCRITSNHRPSVASRDGPLGHEHDTTGFWNYSRCRWARVSDFIERGIDNSSSWMGLSHQAIERDGGRCRPSRKAEYPPAASTSRCVRASGGHRMIAARGDDQTPMTRESNMDRKMRTLEVVDDRVAEILREKTEAERLAIANGLWRFAREMTRAIIARGPLRGRGVRSRGHRPRLQPKEPGKYRLPVHNALKGGRGGEGILVWLSLCQRCCRSRPVG